MWYTKKGDNGTSKIIGCSARIFKSDFIFEALGGVDELNSWLGLVGSSLRGIKTKSLKKEIIEIQNDLFTVQAQLAQSEKNLPQNRVAWLEEKIDYYENNIPNPKGFVVSGTTQEAAIFDVARAIARRTERAVIRAKTKNKKTITPEMLSYLNRLSSYLYICARYLTFISKKNERRPKYR